MDTRQAILEAGRIVGSLTKLADHLKISKGAVSQWDSVPARHVLAVSAATGWQITPHDLRPDLYPNPTDCLPAYAEGATAPPSAA